MPEQVHRPIYMTETGSADTAGMANAMQIAMAAQAVSITNATEMRLHREECKGRDERNEKKFDTIQHQMREFDHKLDRQTNTFDEKLKDQTKSLMESFQEKYNQVKDDNKESNKVLYIIVAALSLFGAILAKVPINIHF